ncbi:hypothetical protein [Streptococcus acidominimus]|uniref:DUF1433 domain-containing protein n=1 Tax=Streptococcus acidominimus TaxID=1326 RepID=A0A1Q8EFB5_STRAI|nr:hypothetical protein [Streptococcus acidominimus]OLF50482.1 hypothetical protein BU200_01775 [Streptococcus acidominimus]SUN05511.1 Uncharacterised protein [Streptococcus acidominimus]
MKKKLFILLIILGGLVMAFSLNGNIQKNKEAERNRRYEVSLVKALKNSYRDLEKIEISSPDYSVPPGDWSCTVRLSFSDEQVVQYGLSHSLSNTINRSGVVTTEESEILTSHEGSTESNIKVIFSDGKESIE